MFYLVETQTTRGDKIDNFKWLVYLEDFDLAKKAIYNYFASCAAWCGCTTRPSSIIFKTFRKATGKEKRYSMFDEEHYARGNYVSSAKPYYIVCSIF